MNCIRERHEAFDKVIRLNPFLWLAVLLIGAALYSGSQAQPQRPCQTERRRLAELMQELKDLSRSSPTPRSTRIDPDPPAPDYRGEAIANWHTEHDQEVAVLRAHLRSAACDGPTPQPSPTPSPQPPPSQPVQTDCWEGAEKMAPSVTSAAERVTTALDLSVGVAVRRATATMVVRAGVIPAFFRSRVTDVVSVPCRHAEMGVSMTRVSVTGDVTLASMCRARLLGIMPGGLHR